MSDNMVWVDSSVSLVQLTHQQVLDQLSHTGCRLCWLLPSGGQLYQRRQEVPTFLYILHCLLTETQNVPIVNKLSPHVLTTILYITSLPWFYYAVYTVSVPDPLGFAQQTLLTVTEVTVVPGGWVTVLAVIPATEAPTVLYKRETSPVFISVAERFQHPFVNEECCFRAVSKLLEHINLLDHKRKQVHICCSDVQVGALTQKALQYVRFPTKYQHKCRASVVKSSSVLAILSSWHVMMLVTFSHVQITAEVAPKHLCHWGVDKPHQIVVNREITKSTNESTFLLRFHL